MKEEQKYSECTFEPNLVSKRSAAQILKYGNINKSQADDVG